MFHYSTTFIEMKRRQFALTKGINHYFYEVNAKKRFLSINEMPWILIPGL